MNKKELLERLDNMKKSLRIQLDSLEYTHEVLLSIITDIKDCWEEEKE